MHMDFKVLKNSFAIIQLSQYISPSELCVYWAYLYLLAIQHILATPRFVFHKRSFFYYRYLSTAEEVAMSQRSRRLYGRYCRVNVPHLKCSLWRPLTASVYFVTLPHLNPSSACNLRPNFFTTPRNYFLYISSEESIFSCPNILFALMQGRDFEAIYNIVNFILCWIMCYE